MPASGEAWPRPSHCLQQRFAFQPVLTGKPVWSPAEVFALPFSPRELESVKYALESRKNSKIPRALKGGKFLRRNKFKQGPGVGLGHSLVFSFA